MSRLPRPLLAAAMLLAAAACPAEEGRAAREAELQALRARIDDLRGELNRVRGRFDAMRAELRDTERRIGDISSTVRRIDDDLGDKTARLKELHDRQLSLNATLDAQRQRLIAQVRAAYATGRQETVKILLNQEDPAAVGRVLAYYGYLSRARSERIAALRETLDRLRAVQDEIGAETARLQQLRTERMREVERLERTRDERRALVARLKGEISDRNRQLEQMKGDEKELEGLIRALYQALADIPAEPGNRRPFGSQRGKLAWPTDGSLAVGFGSPRSQGRLTWQGVLIRGSEGQPVRAVSHGRVAFADWLRGYGLMIIIDHEDGYMSLYGHNQSLFKETGDWVEAGDTIASLGNSGGRDEPVLYFEIRHNGRPRDPVLWCRR